MLDDERREHERFRNIDAAPSHSSGRCWKSAPIRIQATTPAFPPLIAALSCSRAQPGSPGRRDVVEIVGLLLSFGADPNQRGINDYTALHMAVAERNAEAITVLLNAGADASLPTRIDDCVTPREMAESAGLHEIADLFP